MFCVDILFNGTPHGRVSRQMHHNKCNRPEKRETTIWPGSCTAITMSTLWQEIGRKRQRKGLPSRKQVNKCSNSRKIRFGKALLWACKNKRNLRNNTSQWCSRTWIYLYIWYPLIGKIQNVNRGWQATAVCLQKDTLLEKLYQPVFLITDYYYRQIMHDCICTGSKHPTNVVFNFETKSTSTSDSVNNSTRIQQQQRVCFQFCNRIFFGYFNPENIFLGDENELFSGWANLYFGLSKTKPLKISTTQWIMHRQNNGNNNKRYGVYHDEPDMYEDITVSGYSKSCSHNLTYRVRSWFFVRNIVPPAQCTVGPVIIEYR